MTGKGNAGQRLEDVMKKMMVLVTLVGALLTMTVGAVADAGTRLRVNIPFSFFVDKDQLPAGEYIFEMREMNLHSTSSSSVLVRKADGTQMFWIPTMPGAGLKSQANNQVVFNQYGEKYFLSRVECLDSRADLKAGKAEKEILAQGLRSNGSTFVPAK
jgi:hypothetical protein